jgi:signal peptidase I
LINTLFIALLLAGLIRTTLFQPFWIPTGSMKPNLLVGDFLFVNKFSYGFSRYSCPFSLCPINDRIFFSEPKRGDVVVFRHPVSGKDYIKRLIGLPGDKISIQDGVVFVNEEELRKTVLPNYIENKQAQGSMKSIPQCANEPVPIGNNNCIKHQAQERLPSGKSYKVLDFGQQIGDNTQDFIIGEGKYFFLGDNRDNSLDSRFDRQFGGVGLVPAKYLIGKASIVIFSSRGTSIFYFWTWRKDRLFKVIN